MSTYQVSVEGHTLPGFDVEAVKRALAALARLPEASAARLLSGLPVVVKTDVDLATAERYAARLRAIGVAATIGAAPGLDFDGDLHARLPAEETSNLDVAAPNAASRPLWSDPSVPTSQQPPPTVAPAEQPLAYARASPSRRFFARFVDLWVLGLPINFAVVFGISALFPSIGAWIRETPSSDYTIDWLLLPLVLFAEAVIFGVFGTTLGKALLGVRLKARSGLRITTAQYLKRQLGVYWWGLGTGFPLASLVTALFQWSRLRSGYDARYDEGVYTVGASRLGVIRGTFAILVVIFIVCLNAVFLQISKQQTKSASPRVTTAAPLQDATAPAGVRQVAPPIIDPAAVTNITPPDGLRIDPAHDITPNPTPKDRSIEYKCNVNGRTVYSGTPCSAPVINNYTNPAWDEYKRRHGIRDCGETTGSLSSFAECRKLQAELRTRLGM